MSSGSTTGDPPAENASAQGVPYRRSMPIVLLIVALAVGVVAFAIRDERHTDTVTVTRGLPPTAKASGGGTAAPSGLRAEKETTTSKATSDTTFATLLGVAAVLLILGAFYARVNKITVAGNSVEMAAAQAPAVAQEIAKRAERKVRAASSAGTVTVDEAVSIARTAAEAATKAQADVTRLGAAGAIAAAGSPLSLGASRARALATDAPIPDAVVKRLAAMAMEERTPEA